MAQDTIDVWEVQSPELPSRCVQDSPADVYDILDNIWSEAMPGSEVVVTITRKRMSRAEFEALAEFEG